MSVPRTTHPWLQPFYNALEGKKSRPLQLGSASGAMGFYGASGIQRPTGIGATGSAAGGGVTGTSFFDLRTNGGTGVQYYTLSDIVAILKLRGDITT
jgi:hypothetical protein